jgi:spermidine dehydrogenase
MTNETRDRDLGMDRPIDRRPWIVGRKRFGRIAIANSDAGAAAYTDSAIDQAYRAVQELA